MKLLNLSRSLMILLILLFGFPSTGVTQNIDQVYGSIIPNVLTLEFTIGEDDNSVPPEFLLSRATNFTVMDNGDIIIPDERRLKIFDKTGKAKIVVGNPGEGPGDLGERPRVYSSSTGLITVFHRTQRYPWYNVYDSNYKFLFRNNHTYNDALQDKFEKGTKRFSLDEMLSYGNEERMYNIRVTPTMGDKWNTIYYLWYESDSQEKIIAQYNVDNYVKNPKPTPRSAIQVGLPFFGNFLTAQLSNKRYAYMHPAVDISESGGKKYYTVNMVEINTLDQRQFTFEYPLRIIPENEKNFQLTYSNPETNKESEPLNALLKQMQDDIKYNKPVQQMRSDQNYLFMITHIRNDEGHTLVEIIDVDTEERVAVAYFEIVPDIIKNGFAYDISFNDDGFTILKKYKMDPAVYGK